MSFFKSKVITPSVKEHNDGTVNTDPTGFCSLDKQLKAMQMQGNVDLLGIHLSADSKASYDFEADPETGLPKDGSELPIDITRIPDFDAIDAQDILNNIKPTIIPMESTKPEDNKPEEEPKHNDEEAHD